MSEELVWGSLGLTGVLLLAGWPYVKLLHTGNQELIDEGVQIHCGNGLTKEYFIEKLWPDSRALTIEDGENYTLNRLGGHILKDTYPRTSVNLLE